MESFDLSQTQLPKGQLLIEASAGTGKTFSLTGILLRLIVEENIPIEKILVVTFTEAATAELQDRTRNALIQACETIDSPKSTSDPIMKRFRKLFAETGLGDAKNKLKIAIQNFDQTEIQTIHGFCSSVLKDHSFESNSLFNLEVLPSDDAFIEELANDFWRRSFLGDFNPCLLGLFLKEKFNSPIKLKEKFKDWRKSNQTNPSENFFDLETFAIKREAEIEKIHDKLIPQIDSIKSILYSIDLNKNAYNKARLKDIQIYFEKIKNKADRSKALFDFILAHEKNLELLSQSKINRSLKKSAKIDGQHPIFSSYEELMKKLNETEPVFRTFRNWVLVELQKLKVAGNVITYDDMITRTKDAISQSPSLLKSLQSKFDVGLIDEFQDTDKNQLFIFSKIFGEKDHRLYCVGDPKQSIYKFRGAHIETYLEFSKSTPASKFELKTNYRSTPQIIEGVNALFKPEPNSKSPFGNEIEFTEVEPAIKSQDNTKLDSEFTFRLFPQGLTNKSYPLETVAEVKHQLNKQKTANPHFSSISILINSRYEADAIAKALQQESIPFIKKSEQSVFETNEAKFLYVWMNGVLECGRLRLLKSALASPLIGYTTEQLIELDTNDEALNKEVEFFAYLQEEWRCFGFMSAFQSLLNRNGVRKRFLSYLGGEEEFNNYLHLAELIHHEEKQSHKNPRNLINWFQLLISDPSRNQSESTKLRRSTDADAVTISTIHSSKGLEYDTVILPTAWKTSEDSEESLRKLYVALTRARKDCITFVSNHYRGKTLNNKGALAQLINASKKDDLVKATSIFINNAKGKIKSETPLPKTNRIHSIETPKNLAIRPAPERSFIPTSVSSFSSLTYHDDAPEDPFGFNEKSDSHSNKIIENKSKSILLTDKLPKGASMGTALHGILETIDFTHLENLGTSIEHQLQKEGFSFEKLGNPIQKCVKRWLGTSLTRNNHLTLNSITSSNRLNEMEFYFPMNSISAEKVAAAIVPEKNPRLEKAILKTNFQSLKGFMKGFVDLVFQSNGKYYILDWKSNYLGDTIENYNQEAIEDSMIEHLYPLQYLIYTTALDLYLHSRIPNYKFNKHFGGVFYVYLRGFGIHPGHSVYFKKPQKKTLDNLKKLLARKGIG